MLQSETELLTTLVFANKIFFNAVLSVRPAALVRSTTSSSSPEIDDSTATRLQTRRQGQDEAER